MVNPFVDVEHQALVPPERPAAAVYMGPVLVRVTLFYFGSFGDGLDGLPPGVYFSDFIVDFLNGAGEISKALAREDFYFPFNFF